MKTYRSRSECLRDWPRSLTAERILSFMPTRDPRTNLDIPSGVDPTLEEAEWLLALSRWTTPAPYFEILTDQWTTSSTRGAKLQAIAAETVGAYSLKRAA